MEVGHLVSMRQAYACTANASVTSFAVEIIGRFDEFWTGTQVLRGLRILEVTPLESQRIHLGSFARFSNDAKQFAKRSPNCLVRTNAKLVSAFPTVYDTVNMLRESGLVKL